MRTKLLIIISIIIVILFSGCSSYIYEKQDILIDNAKFLSKQGQIHWEKRSNITDAQRALHFLSLAHKLDNCNIDLAVLYSRACYFNARYIITDPNEKVKLLTLGAESARSALFTSSEFANRFMETEGDSTDKFISALETIELSQTPALYWWTVNTGSILISKPVVERLEHRVLIESTLYKLLSLDPTYFYGGPYRLLGVFYARIPGVDLSQSKSYLDQAIASFPGYFSTRTYLSQFYYTKIGEPELFRQNLEEMLSMDPTLIPEVMPENLFEQEFARHLLSQESKLFE